MSRQPIPAPTASAIGPCPTMIHIVGRPGSGSLPRTIAPPDHPLYFLMALFYKSRKENPQKLTQLSSRSHPRHLLGKRTAQKDTIIDITSESQVYKFTLDTFQDRRIVLAPRVLKPSRRNLGKNSRIRSDACLLTNIAIKT